MYDYVVVGAGSSGAVVASRLAADERCRVLLLEAGPTYRNRSETPADLLSSRFAVFNNDWGWSAEPVPGREMPYPRGKVSGGCSAVNGAIALRGDPEDFDEWVGLGLHEWGFADVLPWYCKLENDPIGATLTPGFHGVGGPVPIERSDPSDWQPFYAAFANAVTSVGFSSAPDLSAPSAEGVGAVPHNLSDGVRMSTALTYLSDPPENLEVRGGVLVDALIIENNRAVGVRLIGVDGPQVVRAYKEIVLAAGAVATPGILVRSGIGPADSLAALDVQARLVLPGVGAKLLDHALISFATVLNPDIVHDHSIHAEMALRYTSASSSLRNDMQIFPTTLTRETAARIMPCDDDMAVVSGVLMKPLGWGSLIVDSVDPRSQPRLKLDYLREHEDLRRLAEAVRISAEICADPALIRFVGAPQVAAGVLDDEAALFAYVRDRVATCFHPCGTAPMGVDPARGAVVDGHGRLHGLDAVRIVDASIMPTIVRSNINLTCIAVAERIADWMTRGE